MPLPLTKQGLSRSGISSMVATTTLAPSYSRISMEARAGGVSLSEHA